MPTPDLHQGQSAPASPCGTTSPASATIRELIDLVAAKALSRGTFRLASGREASYYLDIKQVVLDARGAMLVGSAILDRLSALGDLPDAVGGMSIGADPVTSAVVTMAGVRGLSLGGFLIRKEPKGHGTERYLEGPVRPGMRVVIVEDVVTSGGSSLVAIDRAEAFGLCVERVVTVVDRLAGGAEAFTARGIPLEPLLTIRDLGLEPS